MPDKASKGMKLHSTNRSLRSSGKGGVTELEFLKMTKIRKSFLLHATATSFALRGRFHQHFRPTFSRKLVGKLFRRLGVNFINILRANKKQEKQVLICQPTLPLFCVPWIHFIHITYIHTVSNFNIFGIFFTISKLSHPFSIFGIRATLVTRGR